jgi:uncharacterized surface protein with fasciclin (FAS1) repeats
MNKRTWLFAAIAATLAAASGCATTPPPTSVADTIARTPQLSTLAKLVSDAGLADTLRGPGPFTVFAPTDEAFKSVPAATLTALGNDKERLKAVLMYHVVPAKVLAADVKNGPAKTAQGANVALARAGTFITVDDAVVTSADIAATNGVVQVVDRVLMPPAR